MRALKTGAIAILAAAAIVPGVNAQTNGAMEQAIHDTVLQTLIRNGYPVGSAQSLATLAGVQGAIVDAKDAGGTCATSGCTWNQVIKGLADWLPWPFKVGKEGERFQEKHIPIPGWPTGGDFGGAGASGWVEETVAAGRDCGDIEYGFDVQGNFIIPSYLLDPGGPVTVGATAGTGTEYWIATTTPTNVTGTSDEAAVRRALHLMNMTRIPQAWYGVVGRGSGSSSSCFTIATLAYRNVSGNVVGRQTTSICTTTSPSKHGPATSGEGGFGGQEPHKSCPEGGFDSADFHFYGLASGFPHWHSCVMYYPNKQLSPDGYAINQKTTIPYASSVNWPTDMPGFIKQCGIDPSAVKKIADALWKKAAAKPGYAGAPPKPVADSDARPGPVKVEDLADNPGDTPQPTPDPQAPAPTQPTTPGSGSTDVCDFGPGGCDDPGTATPEIDDPPTDFMGPIFDWLPDLPSLDFNTAGAQCPTWDVNLTAYLGSSAQYTLDSHCPLVEQNSAALGALMLAIWGVMAAMIILRA